MHNSSAYAATPLLWGGSNDMKVIYFPMALEPAPLIWLEGLAPNTIDTWEDLKKAIINNIQGSLQRLSNRYDLTQCKQLWNESLCTYTRRFFEAWATITDITKRNIIDCFHNDLYNKILYRDFGRNRTKFIMELRYMMQVWAGGPGARVQRLTQWWRQPK